MIKSTAAFASALALFAAGTASAQEAAPMEQAAPIQTPAAPAVEQQSGPLNTITINPISFALGYYGFEYERAASQKLSWYAGPRFATYSEKQLGSDFDSTSFGLVGGLRYFLTGSAPEGFFLSPNASVTYTSATYFDTDGSSAGYSVGALAGYTWLFGDVVDLSLGLGAQYVDYEATVKYEDADGATQELSGGISGVIPDFRLALGAAF